MEDFNALRELISLIKELSPLTWEAAQQQLQAQIIMSTLWLAGCIVCIFLLLTVLRKSVGEAKKSLIEQDEMFIPSFVSSLLGLAVVIILSLFCLDTLISSLVAPDFQTIKILMSLAK